MAQVKHCLTCGAEMRRRVRPSGNREANSKWKARQHCSLKCRIGVDVKAFPPRQEHPCAQCGKPTKEPKYCSKRCYGDSLFITPRTGKQGHDQARRLYELTACERCDSREELHRHHIDGNPTNNAPQNIAILCAPCHRNIHKAIRRGTQDFQWENPVGE